MPLSPPLCLHGSPASFLLNCHCGSILFLLHLQFFPFLCSVPSWLSLRLSAAAAACVHIGERSGLSRALTVQTNRRWGCMFAVLLLSLLLEDKHRLLLLNLLNSHGALLEMLQKNKRVEMWAEKTLRVIFLPLLEWFGVIVGFQFTFQIFFSRKPYPLQLLSWITKWCECSFMFFVDYRQMTYKVSKEGRNLHKGRFSPAVSFIGGHYPPLV